MLLPDANQAPPFEGRNLYLTDRALQDAVGREGAGWANDRLTAATRRAAGDLVGATRSLARARQIDDRDPALQQEYGALIVERLATYRASPPR